MAGQTLLVRGLTGQRCRHGDTNPNSFAIVILSLDVFICHTLETTTRCNELESLLESFLDVLRVACCFGDPRPLNFKRGGGAPFRHALGCRLGV